MTIPHPFLAINHGSPNQSFFCEFDGLHYFAAVLSDKVLEISESRSHDGSHIVIVHEGRA